VNLLFCNAGLIEAEEGGSLDDMVRAIPAIREEFETNAMGPLRTVHALNSNLKPGASKVIVIGSSTGSVAKAQSGSFMPGTLGYSCTKAAEHMVAVHMSKALAERNIPLGIVHPGTVLTDNALEYHHQDEQARAGRRATGGGEPCAWDGALWGALRLQLVKEKATDTDESVDAIIDIAEHKVNIENTGTFWDARGKEPRPF